MMCAKQVGYREETYIHGVGDGAAWITRQIENVFGINANYLIDFYHLCEYRSPASKVCSDDPEKWYEEAKQTMKQPKDHDACTNYVY